MKKGRRSGWEDEIKTTMVGESVGKQIRGIKSEGVGRQSEGGKDIRSEGFMIHDGPMIYGICQRFDDEIPRRDNGKVVSRFSLVFQDMCLDIIDGRMPGCSHKEIKQTRKTCCRGFLFMTAIAGIHTSLPIWGVCCIS